MTICHENIPWVKLVLFACVVCLHVVFVCMRRLFACGVCLHAAFVCMRRLFACGVTKGHSSKREQLWTTKCMCMCPFSGCCLQECTRIGECVSLCIYIYTMKVSEWMSEWVSEWVSECNGRVRVCVHEFEDYVCVGLVCAHSLDEPTSSQVSFVPASSAQNMSARVMRSVSALFSSLGYSHVVRNVFAKKKKNEMNNIFGTVFVPPLTTTLTFQ